MNNRKESYINYDGIFTIALIVIFVLISFVVGVQCGKWDERQRAKIQFAGEER